MITFSLDTDHGHFRIKAICEARGETICFVPIEHLAPMAVAMLGVCDVLGIAVPTATVIPFESAEARLELEAQYAGYVDRQAATGTGPIQPDPE